MSIGKLWTRRKCLHFFGLEAGVRYSLPLFLHDTDANQVFFTDSEGRPLPCCRDYVYEALDHSLFWLACTATESGCVTSYVYLCMPGGCGGPRLSRATDVLALCESFCGGRSGVLARWDACTEKGIAVGCQPSRISTESFQAIEDGGIGLPPCEANGEALWVEPGEDWLLLRRQISSPFGRSARVRVHLRVHFYDDGDLASCHWLSYSSPVGEASVGLAAGASGDQFYGFMQGVLPNVGSSTFTAWQHSFVPRSIGWHTFELIWEQGDLHVMIDNEPISKGLASGSRSDEVVCLYSSGKGYGVWARLEVFHTPIGQSTWGLGVQTLSAGDLPPWELQASEETGYWQDSGDHVIEHVSVGEICTLVDSWQRLLDAFDAVSGYDAHPAMLSMLGQVHEIVERRSDNMVGLLCPDGFLRFFPPAVCPMVVPWQESPRNLHSTAMTAEIEPPCPLPQVGWTQEDLPSRSMLATEVASVPLGATSIDESPIDQPGLVLQCWSLPHETDIEQIQRVVAHFVALLEGEGVALPENLRLVAPCREASHQRCFVYRFGTRRLHFAARSTDDNNRLVLVVRCGGGFMDFLDFARRHGGLEQLRLHRQLRANGTGTVHLNSTLTEGRVRVREGQHKKVREPSSSRVAGA